MGMARIGDCSANDGGVKGSCISTRFCLARRLAYDGGWTKHHGASKVGGNVSLASSCQFSHMAYIYR